MPESHAVLDCVFFVIPACATASVHPLPKRKDPIALRATNFMWSPPNITTSFSSPIVSGFIHYISLARTYRGWSNAITASWPGLICCTAFITTVMACLIMARQCTHSAKSGIKELWHLVLYASVYSLCFFPSALLHVLSCGRAIQSFLSPNILIHHHALYYTV